MYTQNNHDTLSYMLVTGNQESETVVKAFMQVICLKIKIISGTFNILHSIKHDFMFISYVEILNVDRKIMFQMKAE